MSLAIREYNTKLDSKKRVTIRGGTFDYYHVSEYDDGRIVLEPRELTAPFQVSAATLAMMDSSMKNLSEGKTSGAIDLSEFED